VSAPYGRYLAFPFRIAADGRTAQVADLDAHVHDEIIQLILTGLGERLFLPEFGTNVRRLVFENTDDAIAGLTRATVANALQRWLGHRMNVQSLDVTFADSTITVNLNYRVNGGRPGAVSFQRKVGG
jgi:phage baseplate assembly protein W